MVLKFIMMATASTAAAMTGVMVEMMAKVATVTTGVMAETRAKATMGMTQAISLLLHEEKFQNCLKPMIDSMVVLCVKTFTYACIYFSFRGFPNQSIFYT
mmetsp:Transcript_20384/g.42812  ORF Transcript_20384/g.42812 Transcript_20384/m.42812 type:complete len:100 (-) Transcript_20384:1407-1706(-)